ncbi:MAG: putative permease [Verrucomicrobiales bacterium]|jgi:predicted permease
MIVVLRIFFILVLASMLAVTTWASSDTALWKIPVDVSMHPWFIACLFDAYWGFLTFYCWVIYREASMAARIGWLIAILLFGNIAMSVYMLMLLFKFPTNATARDILLRPVSA